MSFAPAARLRYARAWTALGWAFVALVVYLSLMRPSAATPTGLFDVGHILAYGWLMLWFAQIHRPTPTRLVIGALLCALGVSLEFAQSMTSYRTFDYADMARNALGVLCGLGLARTPLQDALRWLEARLPD